VNRALVAAVGVVVVGLALIVAGVLLRFGLGWALIVAGVLLAGTTLVLVPIPERPARGERPIHGIIP
jgi:hypothetical protein